MSLSLSTKIQYLKGVGPKAAEVFKNIGVETVEDLLTLVPMRYARKTLIKDVKPYEDVKIVGRIIETDLKLTSKGQFFTIKLTDDTGIIICGFFNYSKKAISKFERNKVLEAEGPVSIWRNGLQLVNPSISFFPSQDEEDFLPIYPLSQWFTHKYIRKIVRRAFSVDIQETLPSYVIKEKGLLSREEAIRNLHFPTDLKLASLAKKRLEFEELFWLQVLVALRKKRLQSKGIKFRKGGKLAGKFFKLLKSEKPGFELTSAQRRVCWEIFKDMEKESKMNRLLQGDVGAGKTILAILAMLKAVGDGYQAVLMAPTEVLAEQHYINIERYLSKIGVNLRLLIGSLALSVKRKIQKEIQNGEAQIIIGTHSLIEGGVKFKRLGLVVIDEQHKFGVMQRLRLVKKARNPDVLVMTATPIPRSLSLTIYGDLDISVIDELPPGVGEIETKWVYEDKIQEVWRFVESEINQGKQCYVVYPVIEESEKIDLKAAQESYEKLRKGVFASYKVGLLHGKMKGKEKAQIMEDFRKGKIDILVATTVIEVGIDVPNASCMVIEHAERFGLAQLHQLRGRLRRGKGRSVCILISPANISELAMSRLNVVVRESNGFKLAEEDLKLRGIGEFFGTKQHGLPEMKFPDSIYDTQNLAYIRKLAFNIVENDPYLLLPENRLILKTIRARFSDKMKFLEAG